jgi:hypothetical protein
MVEQSDHQLDQPNGQLHALPLKIRITCSQIGMEMYISGMIRGIGAKEIIINGSLALGLQPMM